ncbi:Protein DETOXIFICATION 16 [Linum perenne]
MGGAAAATSASASAAAAATGEELSVPLIGTTAAAEGEKKSELVEEVKRQVWLAGPMIAVSLLQYSLNLISVMFVGHLGELSLSSASMATSFATVTGFSLLLGMASALDTFCGQAYGAKQYHTMSIHTQRAMLVLLVISIPLSVIWANTANILIAVGQQQDIAEGAGTYATFMIPSIFAYAILQCQVKFLQTQSIVFPMVLCSAVAALLHLLLCWLLVFNSALGSRGAAISNSISNWVNVVLLSLYIKFSPSCAKTWTGFSKEALVGVWTFLKLAIPSAFMVCLEMWSFEMLVLASGLLPNPKLETSVLSISLNTAATVWMIAYGLSAAGSTRVSNELGACQPERARMAVWVVLGMAVTEGLLVGVILFSIRGVWGYAYSNDKPVIDYVAQMLPIVAIANFLDALQCVLSGTARGCGWQEIGAYINLGSYYIVGIPLGILFAFVLHIGGKGLYLGIICALVVQTISLSILTIRTNWAHEAKKASDRVHETMPIERLS